jgi:hypothetical protein
MTTERVHRGGRPRTQGHEDDPLVTVSLHVRQRQLAALDQLADAERARPSMGCSHACNACSHA